MRRTANVCMLVALALFAGAGAATAQVEDWRNIDFPELETFEIPQPEVFELDNGLKVFLMEDHELPLIQASVRVRAGSVWQPPGKAGMAGIFGSTQRTGGTRSMSGDEIDDLLEARAASIETGMGSTVGSASMDCLAQDFDDVLALFVEILRYPAFSEDKIEIAKVQLNSSIARRNDDVGGVLGREFRRLVYGDDSVLSRQPEYDTVAAIERQDLLDWHATYYHPNNMLLGVVGDFDSAEMKRKLESAFASWPAGAAFDGGEIDVRRDEKPGVYFVEKSDVTQANIRVGHLGITVDNPDYFAVQVMNEVLAGGFSGRLFSRLRSEQGLAYGVGGSIGSSFLYPGTAGFGLQTKSESMGQAVDSLYAELRAFIGDEPPTDAELERAKETILNSFVFNYASRRQVLGQQLLYAYYGLPADFLTRYRSNIEGVTTEDVTRVAKRYLRPDEAILLVVGRQEDFDRPMSSFGEFTELDISIPPLTTEAVEIERTAEALAAGREILASMVATLGGESPGEGTGMRRVAEVVISMQGQTMALNQTMIIQYPDRIYVAMQTPMGEQVMVVDGNQGYVSGGGQVQSMPADGAAEQISDLGRELSYIVRYHDSEGLEAVAAGTGEVEGEACELLAISLNGADSTLCVDAAGRVLKQSYRGTHPFTQAPGDFEVFFSDYRQIDGRQVPHRRVTSIDGADFATATLETYEVDPEIDPALFEKPAA